MLENEKTVNVVHNTIELSSPRSAWDKGVKDYALELLENLGDDFEYTTSKELKEALLNGAKNWSDYSWGGCSLIYDEDIAQRLCSPSELKKTNSGQRKPSANEEWLDTQARALHQAFITINTTFKKLKK